MPTERDAVMRNSGASTTYDPQAFPPFAVTVDVVVMLVRDEQLQVLLVQRGSEPSEFEGMWALPGGFKRPAETLGEAAQRELAEETGIVLPPGALRQVGAYGDPGRDPRMDVVSVGYLAAVPELGDVTAGTDAVEAQLWPASPATRPKLAFDHGKILDDVLELVRSEAERGPLPTEFLPRTFTLTELRQVYDAIWQAKLDPGNFHRQFTSDPGGWLIETRHLAPPLSGRGRPAMSYRRSARWKTGAPISRPRQKPSSRSTTG